MHLVGFIIRICHDARSSECKKVTVILVLNLYYFYVHLLVLCQTLFNQYARYEHKNNLSLRIIAVRPCLTKKITDNSTKCC